MRIHPLATILVLPALLGQQPLTTLPYTPSLDIPSMDRTVEPCDNFYKYACGGWMKNNPIPPDQATWSVYGKLTYENQLFLWGLLEQAGKTDGARSVSQQKIGDFFYACMDEAAAEKAGAGPIEGELREIDELKSLKDLPALLAREHLTFYASSTLFNFGSNQDFSDSSQSIAFAGAGGARFTGPGLLHQDRREVRREAPKVSCPCSTNVRASGRRAGCSGQPGPSGDAD